MSFWPREQPRGGRAGHDRHSQDQWEHQEGRGRPEHGFHFQMPNPWEQQQPHPTTQRDHAPVADPKNNETITIKIPAVSWKELQYPSGKLGAVPKRPEVIDEQKQMEYLKKILSSKVYDVTSESPLHFAPNLSKGLGVNIWLKREDTHPVYSFKLRGAYNMISSLPKEELEKGVISASTGNHAQGVAFAASKLKTQSLIVMPRSTPPNKIEAVKDLGGNVVLFGDTFDDALEHAKQLSQERNLKIIPPFDDEDIIVGQGTVGMEIGRQMREPLDAIFVPVGGGGLLAGVASFYKLIYPEVKIIGVEPHDANSMASALYSDQIVQVFDIGTFADGVDIKRVGDETFRISRELVDGIVLVDKNDIAAAIKEVFEDTKSLLEPAGALAVAGAKAYCKYNNIKGGNVVAITSGANMNFDQLGSIADKVESEATFATILPEKPGTLKSALPHLVGSRNITEIKYRQNSEKDAIVFYSVQLSDVSELENVKIQIESSPFKSLHLTNYEVFKNHLRYMGGFIQNRAFYSFAVPEVFYSFRLPERIGALSECLDAVSPRWNVSLIHYRRQGTISGDVLIGLQVPDSDMSEFNERIKKLPFNSTAIVQDDPASKLFTYI